jgi:CGNR zinc finger
MKRARGTMEEAALAVGMPPARAKRMFAYQFDKGGGPGTFLTLQEQLRQLEILELANLRWLLSLAESVPVESAAIDAEIGAFIGPHLDNSTRGSLLPSQGEALEFVRAFVTELKQFIDTRGTCNGHNWKVKIGEVSKTLSWEEILTGGSLLRAADWRGAFLLHATELIEEYGNRIRRCAYPDCARLFIGDAAGHQKFCSLKCGAVERQRKFRAKTSDWTAYRRSGRQRRKEQKQKRARWVGAKLGKEKQS